MPDLHSPFNAKTWEYLLQNHPDRKLVKDLLNDITHGVRIGYQPTNRAPIVCDNHASAKTNTAPVAAELERELTLQRKVGPFLEPPFSHFVGSPMGAIPKKHSNPPKWRIIHDLSWPAGHFTNDGIPQDLFSCSYDSLDSAICILKHLGPGALMSKLDLSDAFRHILVHKDDWELLGSTWPIEVDGQVCTGYFYDAFPPFGLRSSPALFLKFIAALKFVMLEKGTNPIWNYLDDFWTCGLPAPSTGCKTNLDTMLQACEDLGFTVNPDKTVQPSTTLTLLGIELDTLQQEARIDLERLRETSAMLDDWVTRKTCTKRQLQSLVGKLNFICSVCRPGRTFLRRMISLLCTVRHATHHIRLTAAFRRDVAWWRAFLPSWNGCSFFYNDIWSDSRSLELYTDASKNGFGAYFAGEWISASFASHRVPASRSIAFKELYAIAAAVTAWAPDLASKNILFHCDNMAVVEILGSGTSKCANIMTLVRYLFYVCAANNILLRTVHISGVDNGLADCLSRFQVDKFHSLAPRASRHRTFVPRLDLSTFS